MARVPGFVNVLPLFPVLLAHLAGVVVAIILLVRSEGRRTPATLALLGFALLSALDLAKAAQGPLIGLLSRRTATGIRLVTAGVGCCYSVFDVTAVLCLIIAIWQAMRRHSARKAEPRTMSTPRAEG
ncbi:MAG: hypothetical protein R6X31_01375 [Anaerolineae bacterium]